MNDFDAKVRDWLGRVKRKKGPDYREYHLLRVREELEEWVLSGDHDAIGIALLTRSLEDLD